MQYRQTFNNHILLGIMLTAIQLIGVEDCISQKTNTSIKGSGVGNSNSKVFHPSSTKAFEFFEAHALPEPKGAKAVLVLAVDLSKPRVPLEDEEWREFAEKQNFALMSLGYRLQPDLRDQKAAGRELADLIEKAVGEIFGEGRKKIGFAQNEGAELFLRALNAKPETWTFWASKGALAYPLAPRAEIETKFPPGIVMSVKPDQYESARRYFLDLRHIDRLTQRVTFVGGDTSTIDDSFFDRFFQQYVSAIYEGRAEGQGKWCFIYAQEVSPDEGKGPWFNYSWVPNEELAGAWRLLNLERANPSLPEFSSQLIKTPVGDQKVWVRTPGAVAKEGEPARSVILWLTRAANDKAMEGLLRNQGDPIIYYAEQNQIPILAWNCAGIWPSKASQTDQGADVNVVNGADQAFVKIGDAMYERLREYCREQGWPDHNWFLSADSGAGRYGLSMAQAYPFMAVQLHSASGFDKLTAPPSVPWLVTCGWPDPSTSQHLQFSSQARNEFWPVLFKRLPGMNQNTRWDQRALSAEFFAHVISLRGGGIESHQWASEWKKDWEKPPIPEKYRMPKSAQAERPQVPPGFKWGDYAPDRPRPRTIGEWFAEECRRARFLGDGRRIQLSEDAERKWVAPWWSVRLPTRELAEAWSLMDTKPPELTEKEINDEKSFRAKVKTSDEEKVVDSKSEATGKETKN